MKTRDRGFTLVELLITVVVIGLLGMILTPLFNQVYTAQAQSYAEKHRMNNQLIGNALRTYAENSTTDGRLPAPYSGGGYTSTIYNPGANAALSDALTQSGVSTSEINDDGTVGAKVRVYQLVQGLTQQVPIYAQSGSLVTLTYDYGAVYLTACERANGTCNPAPATGVPGTSPAMSSSNYTTWTTSGSDSPPFFVSSLSLQKQMLATTVQRIDRIRDALVGFLRAQQITAPGNDLTNWYPNQAGLSAAGTMSGKNPATTQGCRDGWYSLASSAVSVLPAVGLAREEHGVTAWGGVIEYCRDYDPLSTGVNTPPHYAAIRFLANVTSGGAPDAAIIGNNVIVTF